MQRIIVIVLAILITLPIVIKSRVKGEKPSHAAFSIDSSSACMIRVSGNVYCPGIYSVPANILAGTAIQMAVPVRHIKRIIPSGGDSRRIAHGDHLQLSMHSDGSAVIAFGVLSSNERIILGIPLDINRMTAEDFDLLPGIGPSIAQRIIEYRQKNGGIMRLEDLLAIEGIGEKKYMAILDYF